MTSAAAEGLVRRWGESESVVGDVRSVCGAGCDLVHQSFLCLVLFNAEFEIARISGADDDDCGAVFGFASFVYFAGLSDRIGRRPIMIAGCFWPRCCTFRCLKALAFVVNPALDQAQNMRRWWFGRSGALLVSIECAQYQCAQCIRAILPRLLTQSGIAYSNQAAPAGMVAQVIIGSEVVEAYEGGQLNSRQNSVCCLSRIFSLP